MADLQGELGVDVARHVARRVIERRYHRNTRGAAVDGDVSNGVQDYARRTAEHGRPVQLAGQIPSSFCDVSDLCACARWVDRSWGQLITRIVEPGRDAVADGDAWA